VVGRSGRSVVPRGCPPPIVLSRHHVTDRPQDRPTTGPTDHRTDRPQDHARAIYGAMDTSITSCALVLNVLNHPNARPRDDGGGGIDIDASNTTSTPRERPLERARQIAMDTH